MELIVKLIIFIGFSEVISFSYLELGSGFRYITKRMSEVVDIDTDDSIIETKRIEQPVDHFNKNFTRTWSMRYFQSLKFWAPNAPVYLFIGGHSEISTIFLKAGIMFELANETRGAMFASEHRYYGESITDDNIEFLDSKQAIADLARLLRLIKSKKKFQNSKVVVIGASDSGKLAVWLRIIFPKRVDAVIASSAPILATYDFDQFLVQVAKDYQEIAPAGCWQKIKSIFQGYEEKINRGSMTEFIRDENICPRIDMNLVENQQFFIQCQLAVFMACAQGSPAYILNSCDAFYNFTTVKMLTKMFDELHILWNNELRCFDYDFYKYVNIIRKIPAIRDWIYHLCTEVGYFQTTTSDEQPFTKRLTPDYYIRICSVIIGPNFNEQKIRRGIKYTNYLFGGLKPNVTKVIFVNGELDPWKHLSVTSDLSAEARAFLIPNSSHCSDIFPSRPDDSQELQNARLEIKQQIKIWLGLASDELPKADEHQNKEEPQNTNEPENTKEPPNVNESRNTEELQNTTVSQNTKESQYEKEKPIINYIEPTVNTS